MPKGLRWSEEGRDPDLASCGFGHICEIWGYHGCVAEDISRLECEAELLGQYFPAFRKILHFQVLAAHLHFHIYLGSVAVNFVISYTSVNFLKYFPTFRKILHFQVRAANLHFHISLGSVKAVVCDQLTRLPVFLNTSRRFERSFIFRFELSIFIFIQLSGVSKSSDKPHVC